MKKPFENKKEYDPGRLTSKISFVTFSTVNTPSGGTTETETILLNTWAGKDKVSDYNQMAIQAGATIQNKPTYFVIRNRKNFYPDKTMTIKTSDNIKWQILGIVDLDNPVTYIQMLCVLSK